MSNVHGRLGWYNKSPVHIARRTMSKNDERNVIDGICKIAKEYDCSNPKDINHILGKVQKNKVFQHTSYGRKYIKRLTSISLGERPADCMLCGGAAKNGIVCENCIAKVERHTESMLPGALTDSEPQADGTSAVGTIKKLTTINVALTIVNIIAILVFVIVFGMS